MSIISLVKGARFEIFAYGKGDKKPEVVSFMDNLSDRELSKLVALLVRSADHGIPTNKEKCRLLEDGIYEFKSGDVRLAWFYDTGKIIITVHAFKKKRQKTTRQDIEKALIIRVQYYDEKSSTPKGKSK